MLDLGEAGDLVEADRNDIRLTRPVTLDILEAQAEAGRGLAPRLLTERRADLSRLFADFEDIDPEFNLWIAVQRERLVAQLDRAAGRPRWRRRTSRAGGWRSPRRWPRSTRPTRAPAGRRCRRTWRSATPPRRCAATSGSGRCSTRSSTSSPRRRPRRSTSRSSRASSSPPPAARAGAGAGSARADRHRRRADPGRRAAGVLPLLRPDLPRRDDRRAVAVPRLAGDRRRAGRPDAADLPRLLPAHHAARPRRQHPGRHAAPRPGRRPLRLGRAARRRRSTACRRCTGRRCASWRWRSTSTSRRRGCSRRARPRARWGASTSSGCRRRRCSPNGGPRPTRAPRRSCAT